MGPDLRSHTCTYTHTLSLSSKVLVHCVPHAFPHAQAGQDAAHALGIPCALVSTLPLAILSTFLGCPHLVSACVIACTLMPTVGYEHGSPDVEV